MMFTTMALLAGCSAPESTGTWMERTAFSWVGANHRLSHYGMRVEDDQVGVALVGGTSTTGIFEPLPDGCDQATCDEFPIADRADIAVGWARLTTKRAVFGAATADLLVDAAGASVTLDIPLEHEAKKGDVSVVIRGFRFDTDRPLQGDPACYRPKNGWLPKGYGIELGEPTLSADGASVTVDVQGHFEAGPTYEDERTCLDEVIDRAQVGLSVDVLAIVADADHAQHAVEHGVEYAYTGIPSSPGEQPDPDFAARTLGSSFEDPVVGWSAFAFSFHDQGQPRGAYLRTVEMRVDAAADQAWGHATNYSPGTQLSGFDYTFTGRLSEVDLEGPIDRGTVEDTITVDIQDDGSPAAHLYPF